MKILVIVLLIITVIVLGLLAYKNTTNRMPDLTFWDNNKPDDKKDKKDKKDKNKDEKEELNTSTPYKIEEKYIVPEVLSEISDISHLSDNLFACIQDEAGTIYIYNTNSNSIEKEIPFAGKGDYEGIALAGNTAYVINSGGVVFEVSNIQNARPAVRQYKTFLKAEDDVEALCFDKAKNRLLLAFKREEANKIKGIYAFDLKTKQLAKKPVYTIDLNHTIFQGDKKKEQGIKPSAIAIQPTNGDIYITEGTNPKLLVLDNQGNIKSLVPLNKQEFAQPEGITFNKTGELFISNEGKKGEGNILEVKL
jgi:uncharacterized protein YjiK